MPAEASNSNAFRSAAPTPNARSAVTTAIRQAAKSTGANFDYLLATAKVESDLNPSLTMRSSTATGLFQFLEQTWLGVMKTAGRAFGMGRYADAITQSKSGRYEVADPRLREEMMRLRKDPVANAAMGGVVTRQNEAVVTRRIGRKPSEGELYVAHFFGPHAGAKVINLAKSNPNANAAAMFPAAARANRPIFYDKGGEARSIAGVYDELVRRYQVAKASPGLAPMMTAQAPAQASVQRHAARAPVAPVAATANVSEAFAVAASQPQAADDGSAVARIVPQEPGARVASAFHSLFETEDRRGPVAPVVAQLWGAPAARRRAEDVEAIAPAENGKSAAPLDLFQDGPVRARGLFTGKA